MGIEINRHTPVSSARSIEPTQSPASKPALEVGQIIEGIVIKLQDDLAQIQVGARSIWAQSKAGDLILGQSVQLEVTDIVEGQVFAQRSDRPETRMLSRLGVRVTQESSDLMAAILRSELPPTRELVQQIRQMTAEARMLGEELSLGKAFDVAESMDIPIRQIALSLMNGDASSPVGGSLPSREEAQRTLIQLMAAASKPEAASNQAAASNQLAEAASGGIPLAGSDAHAMTLSQRADAIQDDFGGLLPHHAAGDSPVPHDRDAAAVRTLLTTLTPQVALKLIQNDQPLTLRTLLFGQMEPQESADRLIALAKQLPELADRLEALAESLSELSSDDAAPQQWLREAESAVNASSSPLREAMRENLMVIREQLMFRAQPDGQIYYMPVPMQIDDRHERVDLYLKKRARKAASDEFHILVALNTLNFGEVRCIVSKYGERIELSFGLASSEYVHQFEREAERLQNALDRPGVTIRFREREEVDTSFFAPPAVTGGFDRRV